ncbi:MAG: acyltransferase [Micrococcales bacterium]|nr:MAG: acyltransferase [Micrococcales bacterium]
MRRLRGHANAFGLFRLVMASMVIFSHAFYLGHWGEDPTLVWSNHQSDLGNLAVLGFFVISGYLIAKSAMSTNIMSYFWRRGLRIFPGFLVVLVVGAVILGPWFYYRLHGSMAGYWTWESPGPWTYVRDNASLKMRQYGVHDVLLQTPYGQRKEASVINGSLWTLWYEWRMYVIVGLLAFTGFTRPKLRWIIPVGTLAVFAAGVLSPHVPLIETVNYKIMGDVKGLQLASMFLVGSTVAVYADRIPFNRPVALIGGLVAVMTFFTAGFTTIGYVGMGYFVLWAAAAAPKSWYRIGTRNDISYGVYIYAWPTQMALAYFGGDTWGYIPYVAATFAITIPLAWLSWKLIENPMLHLKDAGPGKWGNQLTRWIKDRRARPSAPGSEYVEQDREPVKV